ncbi:hypothetical protein CHUAL_008167 [Chamberlinius hualienensis]
MSFFKQFQCEKWLEEIVYALESLLKLCQDKCPTGEEIERILNYISAIGLIQDSNIQLINGLVFVGFRIMYGIHGILLKLKELSTIKEQATMLDDELTATIKFVDNKKLVLATLVEKLLTLGEDLKSELTQFPRNEARVRLLQSNFSQNAQMAAAIIQHCRNKLYNCEKEIDKFIGNIKNEDVFTSADISTASATAATIIATAKINPTVGGFLAATAGFVGLGVLGSRLLTNSTNDQLKEKMKKKLKVIEGLLDVIQQNEDEVKVIISSVNRFTEDIKSYYPSPIRALSLITN